MRRCPPAHLRLDEGARHPQVLPLPPELRVAGIVIPEPLNHIRQTASVHVTGVARMSSDRQGLAGDRVPPQWPHEVGFIARDSAAALGLPLGLRAHILGRAPRPTAAVAYHKLA
jgi:hypothetical protein